MPRYAFKLRLKNEDVIAEYERIHANIDEITLDAHRRAGFRNYSIFRSELDLFGVFESGNPLQSLDDLTKDPTMEPWFTLASPFLEYNDQGRPIFIEMKEVFYME